MRRFLKWLGIGLGSILGLVLLVAAYFWVAGGRILNAEYDQPTSTFAANPATADIDAGRRAALLRGCFEGCHGENMEGSVWYDDFLMGAWVAPDLTRAFAELSDQDLDRVIRHGVRRNGKSTLLMPSAMLYHLSDTDLNNIMAFIRSREQSDGPVTEMRHGLMPRFFVVHFGYEPQAMQIRDDAPWLTDGDPPGKYLAITVCTECHGMDLRGSVDGSTPSLAAVVAYTLDDFKRLMREGVPIGDRELDLMKDVALGRFIHFTDAEIEALHGYLVTLVNEALPTD